MADYEDDVFVLSQKTKLEAALKSTSNKNQVIATAITFRAIGLKAAR